MKGNPLWQIPKILKLLLTSNLMRHRLDSAAFGCGLQGPSFFSYLHLPSVLAGQL